MRNKQGKHLGCTGKDVTMHHAIDKTHKNIGTHAVMHYCSQGGTTGGKVRQCGCWRNREMVELSRDRRREMM